MRLYKLRFYANNWHRRYIEADDIDTPLATSEDRRLCWSEKRRALEMIAVIERQYAKIGIICPELAIEFYDPETGEEGIIRPAGEICYHGP